MLLASDLEFQKCFEHSLSLRGKIRQVEVSFWRRNPTVLSGLPYLGKDWCPTGHGPVWSTKSIRWAFLRRLLHLLHFRSEEVSHEKGACMIVREALQYYLDKVLDHSKSQVFNRREFCNCLPGLALIPEQAPASSYFALPDSSIPLLCRPCSLILATRALGGCTAVSRYIRGPYTIPEVTSRLLVRRKHWISEQAMVTTIIQRNVYVCRWITADCNIY